MEWIDERAAVGRECKKFPFRSTTIRFMTTTTMVRPPVDGTEIAFWTESRSLHASTDSLNPLRDLSPVDRRHTPWVRYLREKRGKMGCVGFGMPSLTALSITAASEPPLSIGLVQTNCASFVPVHSTNATLLLSAPRPPSGAPATHSSVGGSSCGLTVCTRCVCWCLRATPATGNL